MLLYELKNAQMTAMGTKPSFGYADEMISTYDMMDKIEKE